VTTEDRKDRTQGIAWCGQHEGKSPLPVRVTSNKGWERGKTRLLKSWNTKLIVGYWKRVLVSEAMIYCVRDGRLPQQKDGGNGEEREWHNRQPDSRGTVIPSHSGRRRSRKRYKACFSFGKAIKR
jgi:hypothetical protein